MCEYDLIVIGHILKEWIIFADEREMGPLLGGPAAYSAVAAARSGAKVGLVSRAGRDMSDELLEVLRKAGVDILGVEITDRGTENRLVYDEAGNKRLEFLHKAGLLKFGDIPEAYLDARMFLICPIDYEIPLSLLEELSLYQTNMAVDLGGYGGASSQVGRLSVQEKICYLDEILPCFNVVKGSREDIQRLYRNSIFGDEEFLTKLKFSGVPLGIVTCGADGALLQIGEETHRVPVFTDKAVDTTGAGDAWFGAFLAEYIKEKDAYQAAVYASRFASIMVESSGGVNMLRLPGRSEIQERI